MAETLVLAELSISAEGVVSGVAVAGGALDGLGRKTEDAGKKVGSAAAPLDLVTKRMFNLRTAAVALLGSFTLAGVIFQVVELAKNLVTGTDAWKRWSEAAVDAFKAVSGGEGMLERISRHLSDAAKGTGITPGLTTSESVAKLIALQEKVKQELLKIPAGMSQGATARDILARQTLVADLDNITRGLVKLQEQSGLTQGQFDELFGTNLSEAIVQATRLEDGFNDALHRTAPHIQKAIKLTGDWNQELILNGQFLHNTNERVKTNLDLLEQWEAAVALVIVQSNALSDPQPFNFHLQQIEDATAAYERFGIVASAAYEAIGAAAAAGVISAQAAMRVQLALLAVEALLKGKIELAEAVAAAARYDFGGAALHGIAAGLYFAAAAFYGRGAILGTAGAGGGGGGGAGAAAPQQAQPQRTVNVYFPNGIFFGANEAQASRQLADYLRRAERGGG